MVVVDRLMARLMRELVGVDRLMTRLMRELVLLAG